MTTTTKADLTQEAVRARAASVAEELEAALAAVERAKESAAQLHDDLDAGGNPLPRLAHEVDSLVAAIASDLGAEIDGEVRGAFDLERVTEEAADLVDLIDLASTNRKERTRA